MTGTSIYSTGYIPRVYLLVKSAGGDKNKAKRRLRSRPRRRAAAAAGASQHPGGSGAAATVRPPPDRHVVPGRPGRSLSPELLPPPQCLSWPGSNSPPGGSGDGGKAGALRIVFFLKRRGRRALPLSILPLPPPSSVFVREMPLSMFRGSGQRACTSGLPCEGSCLRAARLVRGTPSGCAPAAELGFAGQWDLWVVQRRKPRETKIHTKQPSVVQKGVSKDTLHSWWWGQQLWLDKCCGRHRVMETNPYEYREFSLRCLNASIGGLPADC